MEDNTRDHIEKGAKKIYDCGYEEHEETCAEPIKNEFQDGSKSTVESAGQKGANYSTTEFESDDFAQVIDENNSKCLDENDEEFTEMTVNASVANNENY